MKIPSQSSVQSRNQLILSALCNRLNLDPEKLQGDILKKDIKSLCANVSKSTQSGTTFEINDEVMKWIECAENFPVDSEACLTALNELNGWLSSRSVLAGEGMTPSEADIVVFSALYTSVKGLPDADKKSLPHVMRWLDYIQNKEDFGETFQQILVDKDKFEPPASKIVEKVEVDSNVKKIVQVVKDATTVEKGSNSSKGTDMDKGRGDTQAMAVKKKLPETVADGKDKDISVSLLKIQVGLIQKAWKHPSADSLLVEEIDTGDTKLRQVVSGLAKYCSPDELTNRRVVLITNVKPGKLRDVMSEGLVLCASSEDHSIVEPLIPPEGAKVGECVSFSGHDGKPEDVLNPKKKQLEKITPHLYANDKGVATFKGIPFMTSGGPCTSSIPNASIK